MHIFRRRASSFGASESSPNASLIPTENQPISRFQPLLNVLRDRSDLDAGKRTCYGDFMPWLVTTGASVVKAPLFVIGFLWLSAAIGRRIERWFGISGTGEPSAERAIVAVGLGAGSLQLVPLSLGAIGHLRTGTVRVACISIALALAPDLRRVGLDALRSVMRQRLRVDWLTAWILALVPGLLIAALLALTPTIDPDGLGYHLAVPKRWLTSGSLQYLPTYPNSNMPMGVEMLFTIALCFVGDAGAKFLEFALGVLGAWGLFLAGARVGGKVAGAIAVSLFLFGPLGVTPLLGWAYLEGITSFAIIGASLAWLVWFERREEGWLRCSLALAGIAVSFKITAGLLPAALFALTAAVDRAGAETPKTLASLRGARSWIAMAALTVLPVTPWLIRSTIVTGNPFFPMFVRFIPSRDFSPALGAKWEYFNRYLNWAIVIGAHWTVRQRQIILGITAIAIALCGAISVRACRTPLARGVAATVAMTVLLQVAAVGFYLRYWIPLAAVLFLPAMVPARRWLVGIWPAALVVAGTLLGSAIHVRRGLRFVDYDLSGLIRTALGADTQQHYLERHVALYPIYQRINQSLPLDTRVLLSTGCAGFYIDRTTFCTDVVQGSLSTATWSEFVSDARRLGITHVVAPLALATGVPLPPPEASGVGFVVRAEVERVVGRMLMEQGTLLESAEDEGLYALQPEHESSAPAVVR